jgi:hypothetical protein
MHFSADFSGFSEIYLLLQKVAFFAFLFAFYAFVLHCISPAAGMEHMAATATQALSSGRLEPLGNGAAHCKLMRPASLFWCAGVCASAENSGSALSINEVLLFLPACVYDGSAPAFSSVTAFCCRGWRFPTPFGYHDEKTIRSYCGPGGY